MRANRPVAFGTGLFVGGTDEARLPVPLPQMPGPGPRGCNCGGGGRDVTKSCCEKREELSRGMRRSLWTGGMFAELYLPPTWMAGPPPFESF